MRLTKYLGLPPSSGNYQGLKDAFIVPITVAAVTGVILTGSKQRDSQPARLHEYHGSCGFLMEPCVVCV